MIILKSFAVAFSMYSRIPMPRFKWDEKDMRYHLIFFPLVGAVIGGTLMLWKLFDSYLSFNLGYSYTNFTLIFLRMNLSIFFFLGRFIRLTNWF